MDIFGDRRVVRVIIRRLEHHLAILQHLQELIHLNGMQFADFIQEQHASVSLGHRSGFRLRDSLHAQRPSPLVDGIMHAPQQRVGNGTLVKADAGGIHFNKGRILCKRRPAGMLRRLQHQPGRAGFANAGRSINQHMLRIGAAKNRLEGFNPLFLADNILEAGRPYLLRQGFREMHAAHLAQIFQLPVALPPGCGLCPFLLTKLPEEVDSHHHRHRQLNDEQCQIYHVHSLPSAPASPPLSLA